MAKSAKLHHLCWILLIVFIVICISQAVGGDSSKKKNKNGGGWFGSDKSSSSFGQNNFGGAVKKKGSTMKTLKKAAIIGAVAYGGYQLGKLSGKFGSYGHHGSWGFNDWNRWREIDGFMCRDSNDCNWIDRRLYCQDYELDFQPSALWFGGDVARIVGECACPHGMVWNDKEMTCMETYMGVTGTILAVLVVVALIVLIGCCVCGFFVYKRISR